MEAIHSQDSKERVAKEIAEGVLTSQHKNSYEILAKPKMLAWPIWLAFFFKNSIAGGK
jgi:hypothetical protein